MGLTTHSGNDGWFNAQRQAVKRFTFHYSPYEPTPYSVLQRIADSGHIHRRDHLLDYGCGKGRVAFFMASAVGCRVTGIDHSRKLIDIAKGNPDLLLPLRGLHRLVEPHAGD